MPRRETSDSDRARIVESYLDGESVKTIARILGLKRRAVYSAITFYKNENRIEKKKRGGPRNMKLTEIHRERIKEWVDNDCTLSLDALKERCNTELNVDVSKKTIDRALSAFHFSFKRISLEPVRRNDKRNIEARVIYSNEFMRLLSETREDALFFIDEVGFTMNMRLKRGRSLVGTRAVHLYMPCGLEIYLYSLA
jgi:transposase